MKNIKNKKNIIFYLLFLFNILLNANIAFCNDVNKSYFISFLENNPRSEIDDILIDHNGFLWIGSLDGLHSYDGYGFKSYGISQGLSSNMIKSIQEDDDYNLWIGTYGKGFCKLNTHSGKIYSFSPSSLINTKVSIDDINAIYVDSDNVLIGSSYGLMYGKYNSVEEKFISFKFIESSDAIFDTNIDIKKIIVNDKNIWVGNADRLERYVYLDNTIVLKDVFPISANKIIKYKKGIIVGGSHGIFYVYQKDGVFVTKKKTSFNVISDMSLFCGDLWVGGSLGVYRFDEQENGRLKPTLEYNDKLNSNFFKNNTIMTLCNDNDRRLYIGTRGGGVIVISKKNNNFKIFNRENGALEESIVRSLFEDSQKNLWMSGDAKDISVLPHGKNYNKGFKTIPHKKTNDFEEIMTPKSSKHKSLVIFNSKDGGLDGIDPSSFKIYRDFMPKHIGNIFPICKESDSCLWVGTYGNGLWRIDLNEKGECIKYRNFMPNGGKYSVGSKIIRKIYIDSRGNLWVGHDAGVNIILKEELDKEHPHFKTLKYKEGGIDISKYYIINIKESKSGQIFMGSMGGGVIVYDYKSDSLKSISENDGLMNNSIKSFEEDEKGYFWLASNEGLSKYSPTSGEIINYNFIGSNLSNEFCEISSVKRADGTLLFGGNNGLTVFEPKKIKRDTLLPKIIFTDLYIDNKKVVPNHKGVENQVIHQNMEYIHELKLKYNQNDFAIGFVGVLSSNYGKCKYKYKLEGYDNDWVSLISKERISSYTNIPAGHYKFKVMASNGENLWTQSEVLNIQITPPFWETKLAYFIYIVLLCLIIFGIYRIILGRIMRDRELLKSKLEKKKVEEVAKYKLQFFTNISHELRTPLTLIRVPLEQLLDKNTFLSENEKYQNIVRINNNVNRLLLLINQILDFRKIETNHMDIKLKSVCIDKFVFDIYDSFKLLAKEREIKYSYKKDISDIYIDLDPSLFEKVVYNLLSNAFKYTPDKGEIKICLSEEKDELIKIEVSDNGKGIEEAEKTKIFERYYRSNNNEAFVTGTGIGLSLSKEIVTLHKGKLFVKDNEPKGSIFVVLIPNVRTKEVTERVEEENKSNFLDSETEMIENFSFDDEFLKNINKKTILIVDDNKELRAQMKNILSEKFNILLAENGATALKIAKKNYPDLIITDIMMPIMDGMEFCKRVKEDQDLSHIPVLMLTAKNKAMFESFKKGADAYLSKPFHINVLKQNVLSLLKNRELLKEKYKKDGYIDSDTVSLNPADDKFLRTLITIIEKNIDDTSFTVEELAKQYGVSRIYLNRKIKGLTNETANQFMRNIKLKIAGELLLTKKYSVSEVAWKVGYGDLNTFRTRFKEKFNLTPTGFVKKYMNKIDK